MTFHAHHRLVSPLQDGHGHVYSISYVVPTKYVHAAKAQGVPTSLVQQAIDAFNPELVRYGEVPDLDTLLVENDTGMRGNTIVRIGFKGRPPERPSPEKEEGEERGEIDPGMWPLGPPEGVEALPAPTPLPNLPDALPLPATAPLRDAIVGTLAEAVRKAIPDPPRKTSARLQRLTSALRIFQVMTDDEFDDLDRRWRKDPARWTPPTKQ